MIFGLFYFCVVIVCVNRSRSSFILYRIVKRHSRQSNVRRIWPAQTMEGQCTTCMFMSSLKMTQREACLDTSSTNALTTELPCFS